MKAMRRLLKSTPSSNRAPPPPPFRGGLPKPEAAFIAIGDIHGCLSQLERLWDKLEQQAPGTPVIHVGDYIDRGEQSAGVLKALYARQQENGDIICLAGNHEQMFLQFLDNPEQNGKRWLQFGGLQTLASLGLEGLGDAVNARDYGMIHDMVRAALGTELETWLRNLPLYHLSGNVAVTHAGADPRIAVEEQAADTLMWGHRAFGRLPRQDGIWIVHGHTIVNMPSMSNGIVSVDTGAYATGRLTAAIIRPQREVEFIQAAI